MQKELKYLIINYSEKDLPYIDGLVAFLEIRTAEIVKWFGIDDFGSKPVVTIFAGTKEFLSSNLSI